MSRSKKEIEAGESEKDKAFEAALGQIEKEYGKEAIINLGDNPKVDIPAIPTGSISLDCILGVGGIPRGRITEIYGQTGGGKSTLAQQIIAQSQKRGGKTVYIDTEHAFNMNYAIQLGVDPKKLFLSQPSSGEEAFGIAEKVIQSNAADLVIIDSVAYLTPKAEIEGDIGDAHMALLARLMGSALRKLTSIIGKTKTCMIFINQVREIMNAPAFGSKYVTPGGHALKFATSVRIDLTRIGSLKEGEKVVGNEVKIKIVKNKLAPPFTETTVNLVFGQGIDYLHDVVNTAIRNGILTQEGSWISYHGERVGQGINKAKQFLNEHPDMVKTLEQQIYTAYGVKFPEVT